LSPNQNLNVVASSAFCTSYIAQYFKLTFTLYYNVQSSRACSVETMRQLQYALTAR